LEEGNNQLNQLPPQPRSKFRTMIKPGLEQYVLTQAEFVLT